MDMNFRGLFWKMALPVLSIFTLLILFLIFYIPSLIEEDVIRSVSITSEQTAKQFKKIRGYYTKNIIKKVLATPGISPDINHKNVPGKVPLPATMIHDLSKDLAADGLTIKLYSAFPFPNRSSRRLSAQQQESWKILSASANSTVVSQETLNGEEILKVSIADVMVNDSCVNCHNSRADTPKDNWKIGDVRGVLQVDTNITDQLLAATVTSNKITFILSLVLLLVMSAIFLVFKHTIANKVALLNEAMAGITQGDTNLSKQLEISGKDEVSQLASAFNVFLQKLKHVIVEANSVSVDVASKASNMHLSAAQTKNMISKQSQEIGLLLTSIETLGEQFKSIVDSSGATVETAEKVQVSTNEGKEVVHNATEIITELAAEIKKAGAATGELRNDTEQIYTVIKVINAIADQTNLLALNAAIEAARAGDHGRGFSVVADEVRSLASSTQDSTKQIQEMMNSLQLSADKTTEVMVNSESLAVDSVNIVKNASSLFNEINEGVNEIIISNEAIKNSAQSQVEISHDIENNIAAITDSSNETSEIADDSVAVSTEMEGMSKNLQHLMSRFKT
jgi:methyl-accepting chemotaxis protein